MLNRFLLWLQRIEDGILAAMLTAMILLAASQVALRNIWNSGIAWGDPLLRALLLWLTLLGAMAATRDRHHISIDALSGVFPPAWQKYRLFVIDTFSAVICALLAWQGARLVIMDRESGAIAFLNIPAWLCEAIIPFGFGAMSLRFLLYAAQTLFSKEQP